MKKDTFMKGALISTICIVLSKVLGIVYVIPFNSIIGSQGGALYGYAYNIYILFLNLSTVGVPLAISKIVSEYNTLDYEDAKRRSYKIAIIITSIMAIVSTIILFFFASFIAMAIKGGIDGGNSIEDIAYVIRVSATAIFFVTILSTMRGFLQGQKFITNSSISQVVEQFVRVVVIVVGSYVFIKLYGVKEAVGIAVFGATLGAIFALIYLYYKGKKELKLKDENYVLKEEEKAISNKQIFKKIVFYTIPFVILSVIVSLYVTIDMFTVIETLVKKAGFVVDDAEYIMSCISTWGAKLNIIVTSVSAGIVVSLLPNITSDFTAKNYKAIAHKTNKTLQILFVIVVPMIIGLSLLASPTWTVFYGYNELGVSVFSYSIFTALFASLFTNVNVIMQSVNKYKAVYISLFCGLLFKITMNSYLIVLFSKIGLPAYYGATTATIIGYSISVIISLFVLKKEFSINFKETGRIILISLASALFMGIIIRFLQLYIPVTDLGRIESIFVIAFYAVIGFVIYGSIMYKTKILKKLFKKGN
ncbi:MAG: polysaccharide biosynthesis protein [Bacilli bacterium]|nr:polysaccharide biosynthesis protein [Bacilli bacterium]